MLKFIQKKLKEEKGLTLIELLAVIVILGIIAAIAIPAIGNIIENSRYNAVKSDAINVLNAAQLYFTEDSSKSTASLKDLVDGGYLESPGTIGEPTDETQIVTQGNPNTISVTVSNYSGTRSVQFSSASVQDINDNDTDGSEIDNGDTEVIGTVGG